MGGDVYQWDEANISGSYRGLRGGAFVYSSRDMASPYRAYSNPGFQGYGGFGFGIAGFRVAASEVVVPEPTSVALLLAGAVVLGIRRLRRKA